MVQGELFLEDQNAGRTQGASSFFSRNQLMLSLDKIILLLIAFLILFVLTYSFGYERGRRNGERELQTFTAHIGTLPTTQPNPESPNVIKTELAEIKIDVTQARPAPKTEVETLPRSVNSFAGDALNSSQPEEAISSPKGKYTIQVATVLKREQAEREIAKLLSVKKGDPFFIERGKYFEVCIGGFDSVASARPLLNEFKSKGSYVDAFVRPNPHA
ncbi:MAG: SPOR domain-containing protein [Candidatus Omnitrophica bacterium]|nr:SPOR domain-containing protein [Candidatus Omnitrophota bacterium]